MLASIRRFKLVVISLAIVGLGTAIGVAASRHTGYTSRSVLQLLPGVQVHSMRKTINAASFWRNVVNDRHSTRDGYPGWIHLPGMANEAKSHITTQPVSGRVFTITATASTPHQAASMVRAVRTDFDLYMRPGSQSWLRILTYATNPVRVSSPWVADVSIGLGSGLGLGLLLAAALGELPDGGWNRRAR